MIAPLKFYCFRNALEKQQENAIAKRAMLPRARSGLDDMRKEKKFIFYHSSIIIGDFIVYVIILT